MNQVRFVPIDSIIVTNVYLRLNTKIEELKKSIQAVGLIHPLIINQDNELIAGGRRYSALKELGVEEIPVVVVEHEKAQQELISIDENLMRLPLTNVQMESALNRGREIYETIHPAAKKVKTGPEGLKRKPPGRPKAVDPEVAEPVAPPEAEIIDGKASYVEVTAKKTGLSESAIRSAIIRDVRASDNVKEARGYGELGPGQANELVKLEKEQQDMILPIAKDMTTKDLRRVVQDVQTKGLQETLEEIQNTEPLPKEYEQLGTLLQRMLRIGRKVTRKNILSSGTDSDKVLEHIQQASELLTHIYEMNVVIDEPAEERAPTPIIEQTSLL